jgi:pimeloyl-ACP methyl ester carboxylesterase
MGGLWSFWFTLAHPERITSMVQLGCPAMALDTSAPFFMRLISVPGINRFMAQQMQPKSIETALEGLRFQGSSQEDIDRMPHATAEVVYHMFQLPTFLETWKSLLTAVANIAGANPRYQLRAEELQQIKQPVQFIWGANDVFGNLDVARQATSLIPNALLYEMQAGHIPFADKPEETSSVIREFLGTPAEIVDDKTPVAVSVR